MVFLFGIRNSKQIGLKSYFGLKISRDRHFGGVKFEKQCFYELRNKVPKEERCVYESQWLR